MLFDFLEGFDFSGSAYLAFLAEPTGIPLDLFNYLFCVLCSLLLAVVYYHLCTPRRVSRQTRLLIPLVAGLALCYTLYGWHGANHLVGQAVISYLLMQALPSSHMHKTVTIVCLIHHFLVKSAVFYHFFDAKSITRNVSWTMCYTIQKITLLTHQLNTRHQDRKVKEKPSVLEFMSYVFHFQTVCDGPSCYYSEYISFIDGDNVKETIMDSCNKNNAPPTPWKTVTKRILAGLISAYLFIAIRPQWPLKALLTAECQNWNVVVRIAYMYISITLWQCGLVSMWNFANAVSNASGLGFSGYNDKGESQWDLLVNVRFWEHQLALTPKDGWATWNILTSRWLRVVFYEELLPERGRVFVTFLLSAMWHGFFPRFYLPFTIAALAVEGCRSIRRLLQHRVQNRAWLRIFCKVIIFVHTRIIVAHTVAGFVTPVQEMMHIIENTLWAICVLWFGAVLLEKGIAKVGKKNHGVIDV